MSYLFYNEELRYKDGYKNHRKKIFNAKKFKNEKIKECEKSEFKFIPGYWLKNDKYLVRTKTRTKLSNNVMKYYSKAVKRRFNSLKLNNLSSIHNGTYNKYLGSSKSSLGKENVYEI